MSDNTEHRFTNRLIHEKSPYLLQHAHNPVEWYPWGDDAFEKAESEDKLMLVSIGYATCHWCHVMERESFEDEQVAGFLNEHFVAIKVDREERPDVDKIFMDALHAMGQQGGWPLNMFATPDGRPIAGGTYFPPEDMNGMRGFSSVLQTFADAWRDRRDEIYQNASAITAHLQQRAEMNGETDVAWTHEPEDAAREHYASTFDASLGGFKLQPQNKFPPSMGLLLLLRHHRRTGDAHTVHMVEHTLKSMLAGGIYDQLGGGLSRYSTDYRWLVPHFEKMLYDNALFAQALTEAFLVTGKEFFRAYTEDVLDYILRDMTSPDGAFYSAEDADSEGEEGKFYVWRPEQINALLPPDAARAAAAYWDVTEAGNFERGASILHVPETLDNVAGGLGIGPDVLAERLQTAREQLFAARCQRIRPLLDDKVLTSWNGLAISAMARAGRAFGASEYTAAASRAAEFIFDRLIDEDGRLMRRYREGDARISAYLVDHSQLAVACLDLYEATFESHWFFRALVLMRTVNELFRNESGPYYDTGIDSEPLLTRNMDGYDGVEPSGNSSAAQAFLRLHAYGLREGFEEDAARIFAGFQEHLNQAGASFAAMLSALSFSLAPPVEVAIVGDPDAEDTIALLDVTRRMYLPHAVVAFSTPQRIGEDAQLIPLLEHREAVGGAATAYVCRNMTCQLPVHTPRELAAQLDET